MTNEKKNTSNKKGPSNEKKPQQGAVKKAQSPSEKPKVAKQDPPESTTTTPQEQSGQNSPASQLGQEPIENQHVQEKDDAKKSRKNKGKQPAKAPVAETSTDGQEGSSSSSAPVTDAPVVPLEKQMNDILNHKQSQLQDLKKEIAMIKTLIHNYRREQRNQKKHKKRRDPLKSDGTPRDPSGFARPTLIKDELCDFLGLDHGTRIARTDVTKKVIEYIKAKGLEMPGNKRVILTDEVLEKLIGGADQRLKTMQDRKKIKPNTEVTDQLTYFNLQVHFNPFFIKDEKRKGTTSGASTSSEPVVASASA